MSDLTFHPEFENQIRAAMAVPDPAPAFLDDLRQQLITKSEETQPRPQGLFQRPALRWGLAALVIILVTILLIGPQQVASAFQKLLGLGYIPNAGLVDSSAPVRGIAKPVAQTQDSVRVTVAQVVADSQRTIVQFSLAGIPSSAYVKDHLSVQEAEICSEIPTLYLVDGTRVNRESHQAVDAAYFRSLPDYLFSMYFEAIPPDIDHITLKMPCIDDTLAGSVPENWEFPLQLVPINLQITPVTELTTPVPVENEPAITPQNEKAVSALVPDPKIDIRLEHAVLLEDGRYRVGGTFSWGDDFPYPKVYLREYRWTDAQGDKVGYTRLNADSVPPQHNCTRLNADPGFWASSSSGSNQIPLAFKLYQPRNPGPLTLNVTRVGVWTEADAEFSFDTGLNPQVGQQWDLNQNVLIDGFRIWMVSATRSYYGYRFVFETDEPALENFSVGIELEGETENFCFLDIYKRAGTTYHELTFFDDDMDELPDADMPSGLLTVKIYDLSFDIEGDWQASWTPPEE